MKKFNKIFKNVSVFVLAIMFVFGVSGPITARAALAPGFLGLTSTYSVFGDAGIIGGAAANVWGDVGENGLGNGSISGQQAGTYYPAAQPTVVGDISTAYGDLAAETQTGVGVLDLDIPNTVGPGVYDVGTTATFSAALTLNGAGTYIFRGADSIAQTAGGTMILTGTACASDVYWRTGTQMTFAAGGNIEGTIIAGSAITFANSALTFKGRALAGTNVDLGGITITEPIACATPSPSVGGGSTPIVYPIVPPLISIVKIPTPLALPAGPGSVTYNYSVTNIGTVDMTNVTVADDSCSLVSFISGDSNGDSKLGANEIWKYRCTSNLSQTTTNIATASGKANGLTAVDTASATVVVGLPLVPPLVHLVKIPNVFVLPAGGGTVTYSYTVTNPGTVALSNVNITDDKCTGLPGRVVGHPGDINKNDLLESNEIWTFTCQSNLTQTTTNTGTVTGTANGFIATDFALATVVVVAPSLPKTSLPPSPWNVTILVLSGMFLLVSVSFVMVLRKKTN